MCPQAPHLRQHRSRPRHLLEVLRSHYVMVAQDEDERRVLHSSPCQTASIVPAAHFCVRGLQLCFAHPNRGWAERRETFGCCAKHPLGVHITRHARRLARRLASHNAGRSPLGAPPWRFFTRGRASVTGITRIRRASSSQPGHSAWRATSRASRGQRVQAAAAGRHASLRIQARSTFGLIEVFAICWRQPPKRPRKSIVYAPRAAKLGSDRKQGSEVDTQTQIGIGAAAGIAIITILEPHMKTYLAVLAYLALGGIMIWGFWPIIRSIA